MVDDIFNHARLQNQLKTPICLDESIRHSRDRRLLSTSAPRASLTSKLGRVGGHTSARQIQALCLARSIPVWCGGCSNAASVALKHRRLFPARLHFARRRFRQQTLLAGRPHRSAVEVSPRGTIPVPTSPGLGYMFATT